MPLLQPNYYNLQSTRKYPVDAVATGIDDAGIRLPTDILVDCHIRFPATIGDVVYISGLTITRQLVTVVLLAATEGSPVFTPVGAVTVRQPVTEFRHYAISPLYPGVGGFLVFGGGLAEDYSGRFSSPEQSFLMLKCCRQYKELPIPWLQKLGHATQLSGVVQLLAGADLEIVKEPVLIGSEERDALVIRLVQQLGGRNVLEQYVGPCGVRPESRNCSKPGIETINNAYPDCAGNINIEFYGIAEGPYAGASCSVAGVTLDHSVGLDEICAPFVTERFPGQDLCEESSSASEEEVSSVSLSESASEGSSESSSSSSSSSAGAPMFSVPYCAPGTAPELWTLPYPTRPWEFYWHGPAYRATGTCNGGGLCGAWSLHAPSCRNGILFTPGSVVGLHNRQCEVDIAMPRLSDDDFIGDLRRSAGLVLNYHVTNGQERYYLINLNFRENRLEFLHWTGASYVRLASATPPGGRTFSPRHTYHLMTYCSDWYAAPWLYAHLTTLWPPGEGFNIEVSALVDDYPPDVGDYGFMVERSCAELVCFCVRESPW